jgi:HPt (histidine-containing phosphotransfer) domain-containing protein
MQQKGVTSMSAFVSERADTELALAVLNRDNFKQTAAYLTADVVATYLRTIADRCESLLLALRATARPDAACAEAAHALAGSAGMFGFELVAALGRQFERAILTASPDVPMLGEQFAQALDATLRAISKETQVATA